MLRGIHAQSLEPEKIGALIHFIKEDLGFYLHRAVQKVKCDLSNDPVATFRFSGFVDLATVVERAFFEEWISEELEQIARCVDSLLLFWCFAQRRQYGFPDGWLFICARSKEDLRNTIWEKANSGRKRVYVSSPRIGAESDGLTYLPVSSSVRH
jgi:hypothetical protein